jgi:DNA modification methylase
MLLKDGENWRVVHGDSIIHMAEMPIESVDFSIFSPPFPALYSYTDLTNDIGNSEDKTETRLHLSFFYRQLARIVKPGRVIMVHIMQIARMKRTGEVGLFDFRGLNIRLGERAGLVYEYDWMVRRNPQSQAIRTRSRELQFAGLESDRAKSRGTLCDYLIKFRVPGENTVPVDSENDVSRNDWIQWAEGSWANIKETDTLNVQGSKGKNDTRHVCPLQLQIINRLVRLYTNPKEIVFSPFAGIGSELVMALRLGRRAYGIELKDEYYRKCVENCEMSGKESQIEENLFW